MNKNTKRLRLLNLIITGLVVLNPFLVPFALQAQEAPLSYPTQTSEVVNEDVVSEEEINDVTDVTLDEVINLTEEKETSEIVVNETTYTLSEGLYTINNIKTDTLYVYPLNNDVTINFLTITSNIENSYLTIEEKEVEVNGNIVLGYEFKSNLTDGTFNYEMTLPNQFGDDAKVKYMEDVNESSFTINEVEKLDNVVRFISDHFTIFFVTPTPAISCPGGVYAIGVCFATIQEAIDFAATDINTPHTITIDTGIYNENIVIENDPELEGLTILGSGFNNTIIEGTILVKGGNKYTFEDFALREGATPANRGFDIRGVVYDLTITGVRFSNFSNYALSLDNTLYSTNIDVNNSEFINNNVAIKVASTAKVQGFNFTNNIVNGMDRANSYGIYVAGEETFLAGFGNPVLNNVLIENNEFRNLKSRAIYAEVLSKAEIRSNLFERNFNTAIQIWEGWTNGAVIDNVYIDQNTFNSNGVSNFFLMVGGYDTSLNGVTPTDGIEDIYVSSNTFNGALHSAVYYGGAGNTAFKNELNQYEGFENKMFWRNTFTSNLLDFIYNVPEFNIDAKSTLLWSAGVGPFFNNQVEKKLVHDCNTSPFLHGVCNSNDDISFLNDYPTELGSIDYTYELSQINVHKELITSNFEDITSSTEFEVGISGFMVLNSDNGLISDNGEDSLIHTFHVFPGTYEITETEQEGFLNLGCYAYYEDREIVPSEVIESSFYTPGGESVDVYCINMVEDLAPTVEIVASPSENTIEEAITLSANITGGNEPTTIVSWFDGNFAGCSGNSLTINTPSVPGTYTCSVEVMDQDGDSATDDITVIVSESEEEIVEPTDLTPTIFLSGNLPAINNAGTIFVAPNINFNVNAILGSVGNPAYTYTFGGICSGVISSTNDTAVLSNVLNLTSGNYICSVNVSDVDGDVANASVTINVAGIGAPQVQGENTDDNDNENEENNGDIEGLIDQVCETQFRVSGFVFKDNSGNNAKDNNEEGVNNVDLTIRVLDEDNNEVVIASLTTNSIGYWETELCPGNYIVKVDTEDIPEGFFLGGEDNFDFDVNSNTSNVNFGIYSTSSTGFNLWLILLIILVIVFIGGGYYVYTRNRPVNV